VNDKKVTILTGDPVVAVIAAMRLHPQGLECMTEWVRTHRPECVPEGYESWRDLFPHDLRREGRGDVGIEMLTDNELLVELAGRKCYDSFGEKAGRKSNAEYIANTQAGDVPHASILYHAKITFFFAGISRRVSQEMMRNYVGADRDQEGSPSQESTRYTHHYGFYVAHPTVAADPEELEIWTRDIQAAHDRYTAYLDRQFAKQLSATGKPATGLARKRIYESAIGRMPWEFETSFIWTTNPGAIAKFCRERDNAAADLEMQRFARKVKRVVVERYPNLFPQPWMKEA